MAADDEEHLGIARALRLAVLNGWARFHLLDGSLNGAFRPVTAGHFGSGQLTLSYCRLNSR